MESRTQSGKHENPEQKNVKEKLTEKYFSFGILFGILILILIIAGVILFYYPRIKQADPVIQETEMAAPASSEEVIHIEESQPEEKVKESLLETADEKMDRITTCLKIFQKEKGKMQPAVLSGLEFSGAFTKKAKGKREKYKKGKRGSSFEKLKSKEETERDYYVVCWSFEPFNGAGTVIEGDYDTNQNCVYMLADYEARDTRLSRNKIKKVKTISIPQNIFPMEMYPDRETIVKKVVEHPDFSVKYENKINGGSICTTSRYPKTYILLLDQCDLMKFSSFCYENIYMT